MTGSDHTANVRPLREPELLLTKAWVENEHKEMTLLQDFHSQYSLNARSAELLQTSPHPGLSARATITLQWRKLSPGEADCQGHRAGKWTQGEPGSQHRLSRDFWKSSVV